MPALYSDVRWFNRFKADPDTTNPLFSVWGAASPEGLPNQLRQAFAFLRRHGNGRYTAHSLMKLLTAADSLDEVLATGLPFNIQDCPMVVTATLPFEYDEETEVKRGGTVAAAVLLPDGRLMMAVNEHMRRANVGTALYRFVTRYTNTMNPVVWVHQANSEGGQFALAIGLQPREVNSRGAVAYSEEVVYTDDDSIATNRQEDWEIDDALAIASGRRRPNRAHRLISEAPIWRYEEEEERFSDDCMPAAISEGPLDVRF